MDLLTRLQNHVAMMAPHQRERHAGKLLIEARDEIAKLRETVDVLHEQCAREVARQQEIIALYAPKSGDVLLESPLGTQQLSCGNRVPVENPTTIRVE